MQSERLFPVLPGAGFLNGRRRVLCDVGSAGSAFTVDYHANQHRESDGSWRFVQLQRIGRLDRHRGRRHGDRRRDGAGDRRRAGCGEYSYRIDRHRDQSGPYHDHVAINHGPRRRLCSCVRSGGYFDQSCERHGFELFLRRVELSGGATAGSGRSDRLGRSHARRGLQLQRFGTWAVFGRGRHAHVFLPCPEVLGRFRSHVRRAVDAGLLPHRLWHDRIQRGRRKERGRGRQ